MIRFGGVPYTPENCADIQQDLDRLEKWAERNLMKPYKEKYKVLTWGGITPYITMGWRQTVWKAALQKRTQGSWMNTSQPCASAAKKANSVLSGIRKNTTSMVGPFPSTQH